MAKLIFTNDVGELIENEIEGLNSKKTTKIIDGDAVNFVSVGHSTVIIMDNGKEIKTSTVVKINSIWHDTIEFETENSIYIVRYKNLHNKD